MKVLFILAVSMLGFFIGTFYGSVSIPRNSGLAGPAEILMYGVVVAVLAFVLALVINRQINPLIRKRITIIFLLICLLPICWLIYKLSTNKPSDPTNGPTKQTTVAVMRNNLLVGRDQLSMQS
jgi:ABC-type transport system involved in multi-copper enzyme maturation permease subunit